MSYKANPIVRGICVMSAGSTLLSLPLNSAGVQVHESQRDELLTLKAIHGGPLGENTNVDQPQIWIRINVGMREHDIWKLITGDDVCLLDFPVYAGETVYVASNVVNRIVVYGHTVETGV